MNISDELSGKVKAPLFPHPDKKVEILIIDNTPTISKKSQFTQQIFLNIVNAL